jgi:hypothetical protein
MEGVLSDDHWFDRLNRVVAPHIGRRDALRAAAVLIVGRGGGTRPAAGAGAAQKRCERRQCREHFPKPKDRNFCEIKCGRCRIQEKFCINILFPGTPDEFKVATCCHEHQTCCGNRCVDTTINDANCGGCGIACAADETCIEGNCRQGSGGGGGECRDEDCPLGQRCYDGICGCGEDFKYCPEATRCVREEYFCCGGLPIGYCFPGMDCCGSGAGAYCAHRGQCP